MTSTRAPKKATPAPTEPTADAPTTDVPAVPAELTESERAELATAAAATACAFLVGHTDNNPYHLATKNVREWAPTWGEYIGAQLEGREKGLYTGPVREMTEPGEWDPTNVGKGTPAPDVRAWYATLPRLHAMIRHNQGCAAMGEPSESAVMTWQPTREELYEISVSEAPLATARRLATKTMVKTVTSQDGLTNKQRSELDTLMRAVLKKAEKAGDAGTTWHALLAAAAEEYGDNAPAAILASVARITKGRADSGKWVAAFGAVLRRPDEKPEEAKAEEPAEQAPPAEEK
ncbi:hypothetical protein [Nonomuraea sp. LPB2021202275-12-8]|uniref:hypothetical protein n=1 Tax=Nonomuraea sp. LPB2021202275-12-8 TaxID=3120159 RepID=UPI00300D419E